MRYHKGFADAEVSAHGTSRALRAWGRKADAGTCTCTKLVHAWTDTTCPLTVQSAYGLWYRPEDFPLLQGVFRLNEGVTPCCRLLTEEQL